VRLVFAGTPEVALPTLDALAASRHELVGVVTRPDAPAGRGRKLVASPVAGRAEELGVPVLKPGHPREPDFQEALRALRPDCCPVVAYGAMLPQSALDIPRHGWVNLHFSVLPSWRGAAPVQHAIWAGDEVSGATTFRIVKELDAGPTYGLMTQTIQPEDTAGEPREQPTEWVSYAPKILVEDARVDWTEPAAGVDRRVRACTPAPGAWSSHAGERLKLGPVRPVERERLEPGLLEVTRNAVYVGTGTGPVQLGTIRPDGRKEMDAADWARGARLETGARLGG
jgi:methionyl-tRNA formyltransferase